MQRKSEERFVVGAGDRLQEVLPKDTVLLPPRAQVSGVASSYMVDVRSGEVGDLKTYAGRHAEEKICRSRQCASKPPYLHQYFPEQLPCSVFPRQKKLANRTRSGNGFCADPFPPRKAVKIEIEQENRTTTSAFAATLIHLPPEVPFPVYGAALRRDLLAASSFRQHREASCIEFAQRSDCPQTGPPVRRTPLAILFHFPDPFLRYRRRIF